MKIKNVMLADLGKTDLIEQLKKAQEEINEFNIAISKYLFDADIQHVPATFEPIAEGYDVVQAVMGVVWILENGVSMNNEHIEKMEKYTDSGRINNKAKGE